MIDPKPCYWPRSCRGAVSFTYDDAWDHHYLEVALELEQYGLRATFYPPIKKEHLISNPRAWAALVERGHELGNHTCFHPCYSEDKSENKGHVIERKEHRRIVEYLGKQSDHIWTAPLIEIAKYLRSKAPVDVDRPRRRRSAGSRATTDHWGRPGQAGADSFSSTRP